MAGLVMNRASIAVAVACGLMLSAAGPAAQAATLLDLTDVTGNTNYSLGFTATQSSTTLAVGGYNIPDYVIIKSNSVTAATGPSTNLLGQSWSFTPAPSGSYAGPETNGPVDDLVFGGATVGSYDVFSQTFATSPGQGYYYSFNYANNATPSGLTVNVNPTPGGPGAPGPLVGVGPLAALAAAFALLMTRMKWRKPEDAVLATA